MAGDRRARILKLLLANEGADLTTARVCAVATDVVAVSGAGIMLMSGDVPRGSICTTNGVSELIEELQYTMGEGPCIDAYNDDRPVLEPDLANPATPRWIAFTPPAVQAGVRSIFGFPLQVGGVRLGALNLYRDRAGPLSDDEHADALVVADIAAQTVLVMQTKAPAGALAQELELGANFRFIVHQASGMVAAQLNATVGEALIRLRAHAFAAGKPLHDVANDVVQRRMRFNGGGGTDSNHEM